MKENGFHISNIDFKSRIISFHEILNVLILLDQPFQTLPIENLFECVSSLQDNLLEKRQETFRKEGKKLKCKLQTLFQNRKRFAKSVVQDGKV